MALRIPFEPSIPFYRFSTAVENTEYFFDVRWNGRDRAWYFDISTINEIVVASGLKIVLGTFIGRTTEHELFRNGVFVAWDTSDQGLDATFDDLNTRVLVYWLSIEEVLAMRINREFPEPG
jgi:hypothetical protein